MTDAPQRAHAALEEVGAGPVLRAVGRAGLVAYGVVHLLIAGLAVQIALGGRERADKTGALQAIAATGPGAALLWVITAGLVVLAGWQLAEAVFGHRRVPPRTRLLRIAINLAEAAVFGTLAYSAAKVAAGGGRSGGAPGASGLFALPGGRYLVLLLGVVVVVVAGYAAYRGLAATFLRELDLRGAGLRRSFLVTRLGRAGWTSLGAAYVGTGVLLVAAAVRYDPDQPVGLDATLQALGGQPLGRAVLVVLAAGLAVFGTYCLLDARYRKA